MRGDKVYQEEIRASYGEGRYKINIMAVVTADGISLTVTGGERPHVGALALSVPRPSMSEQAVSCDTWLCPVPGHKDIEAASFTAENICRKLNQKVSVTAGIHIDNATPEEIKILLDNCKKAVSVVVEEIKKLSGEN